MTETPSLQSIASSDISCSYVGCRTLAVWGGIVVVQPNSLAPGHSIYYACETHPGVLSAAIHTWSVDRRGGSAPHYPRPPMERRVRLGDELTAVESRVLRELAAGAHDGQIARNLGVTTRTYRRYITAVLGKLGARTRAHAVAIGIQQGLLPAASAPESPATAPTPPHPAHEPHHTPGDPQHDRQ